MCEVEQKKLGSSWGKLNRFLSRYFASSVSDRCQWILYYFRIPKNQILSNALLPSFLLSEFLCLLHLLSPSEHSMFSVSGSGSISIYGILLSGSECGCLNGYTVLDSSANFLARKWRKSQLLLSARHFTYDLILWPSEGFRDWAEIPSENSSK